MNLDLRNDENDSSQRMLNAIEPGSPLPIHRHRHSSETVVCLRGRLVEEFYHAVQGSLQGQSDQRSSAGFKVQDVQKTEEIELSPNGPVVAVNIPAGQWHTVRALESGSVILEMKDGPFEPTGPEDTLTL